MHQEHFWNLLAKKLAGEASEEEAQELTAFIKANPELSYEAQNLADLWKLQPRANQKISEMAYQKLLNKIDPHPIEAEGAEEYLAEPTKRAWKVPLILSLFFLVLLVIFLINKKEEKPLASSDSPQIQEIYTRPGTRTKIVLPDSSVVWLNAGSRLTYSQPFGITGRTVTLTGEAYFDVVKSKKPFVIHTNGARIKVLGTAFNVRSYASEKKIETSLIRGRIEVMMDGDPDNKYVLKPDEKLTLNTGLPVNGAQGRKEQRPIAIRSTLYRIDEETIAETSWVENKLVFDDEPFEEVARRMERWYGVTIHFKNNQLKTERLTGAFEKQTVWQALEALQISTPFHYYSIKNNQIIITH